ncbi:MAG: hypothetical protein ABJM06_03300 [Gilvibacter sp.]
MQLLGSAALFFVPVVAIFLVVESLVIDLPSPFKAIGERIEQKGDQVKIAVFGSSQIMQGINAAHFTQEGLNFSSGAQHHNTDFNLLKGLAERLPDLETVVFEVSYSHFEIPHNSKHFWKNGVFLKFYDVNTYNRPVYLKDALLFPSHPAYYSERLLEYYLKDSLPYRYNEFGYDTNLYRGKFKRLQYNLDSIQNSKVRMNNREALQIIDYNTSYFKEMIQYAASKDWNIVIISPPTFSNYNAERIPAIVKRRDSILSEIATAYPAIKFLNCESDTSFKVTEFRNENHLNPEGAERFTKKLDAVINSFNQQP